MFFSKSNCCDIKLLTDQLASYFKTKNNEMIDFKLINKSSCDLTLQYKYNDERSWEPGYIQIEFTKDDYNNDDIFAVSIRCYPYKFKKPVDKEAVWVKMLRITNRINLNNDEDYNKPFDFPQVIYTCGNSLEPVPCIHAEIREIFNRNYTQDRVLYLLRSMVMDIDYQYKYFYDIAD